MLRRLLPSVAVVVAVAAGTGGCADDVSPAARYGEVTLPHDELMAEVEEWAKSPTLMARIAGVDAAGAGAGRFNSELVGSVLQNRLRFDAYADEFDERERKGEVEMDPNLVEAIQADLFPGTEDGALVTAQIFDELDGGYAERFVLDIAKLAIIQSTMADGGLAFEEEAFADVEINPRYGRWDPATGSVIAPEGPRPAPGDEAPLGSLSG